MGVLYLTPNWRAPSELWIDRMIEALEPHVVAIGADEPASAMWRGRIPSIRLGEPRPSLWRRTAYRAGLPISLTPSSTAAKRLRGAVNDEAVSCVLVHYLDYALRFETVWEQTDKPLYVYPHGYDTEWDLRHHQNSARVFSSEYVESVQRLSRRAITVANSRCVVERLLEIGAPAERVVLRPYGIPLPSVEPCFSDRTRGVEILYLGRLVDCKGPDLVIRAFERAWELGLDGRLTIAGDGYLRTTCELLRRRSPAADRIRLLGAVDAETGVRLREQADIFTAHNCRGPLSHQEESFGVSVLEAMSGGLPAVTGRSGGVRDTIINNQTGFLFEPGDVEAHARALVTLGSDPELRRRMGAAGYQHVSEEFSCDRRWSELRQTLGLETAGLPSTAYAAASTIAKSTRDGHGEPREAALAVSE